MPGLDVLGGQMNTRDLETPALGPALCWKEKGRIKSDPCLEGEYGISENLEAGKSSLGL